MATPKQFKRGNGNRRTFNPNRNGGSHVKLQPEVEQLEPDFNGKFSVCYFKADHDYIESEIIEKFSGAGEVSDVHMSEKWVFIRFTSKEVLQKALDLFGNEFNLKLGKHKGPKKHTHNSENFGGHQKERNSRNRSHNSEHSDHGQQQKRNPKSRVHNPDQYDRRPRDSKYSENCSNNSDDFDEHRSGGREYTIDGRGDNGITSHFKRNGPIDRYYNGPSKDFVQKERIFNNSNVKQLPQQNNHTQHKDQSDCNSDSGEINTDLFISNIESVELFEQAIQCYNPKHVKLIKKGEYLKYAFVSMWNQEDALTAIKELNGKMQEERRLRVRFNERSKGNSTSEHNTSKADSHSDNESLSSRFNPRQPKPVLHHNRNQNKYPSFQNDHHDSVFKDMARLESLYNGMPELIDDAPMYHDSRYAVDCRVLVTHFPRQTTESELRSVFRDFNVVDICVINNGLSPEYTMAILYMGNIYDAIEAVIDANNFFLYGTKLRVVPPRDNKILKKILIRMETGLRDI